MASLVERLDDHARIDRRRASERDDRRRGTGQPCRPAGRLRYRSSAPAHPTPAADAPDRSSRSPSGSRPPGASGAPEHRRSSAYVRGGGREDLLRPPCPAGRGAQDARRRSRTTSANARRRPIRKRSASLSPAIEVVRVGMAESRRRRRASRRSSRRGTARRSRGRRRAGRSSSAGSSISGKDSASYRSSSGSRGARERHVGRLGRERYAPAVSYAPSSRARARSRPLARGASGSAALDGVGVEARARALERDDRLELAAARSGSARRSR